MTVTLILYFLLVRLTGCLLGNHNLSGLLLRILFGVFDIQMFFKNRCSNNKRGGATKNLKFVQFNIHHLIYNELLLQSLFSKHFVWKCCVKRFFFYSVSVTLFKMRLFHAYVCCESPLEMVIKIQHMLLSLSDHAYICGSILSFSHNGMH